LDRLVGVQGTYSYGETLNALSTFTYDILGNMRTRGDSNLYRLSYNSALARMSILDLEASEVESHKVINLGTADDLIEVGSDMSSLIRANREPYRLSYDIQPYRPDQAIIGGDSRVAFTWDAAGNLVAVGSNSYAYNGFGRLATATYSGEDTFQDTFSYDNSGSRVYRAHDILGDELDPVSTYSVGQSYEQDSDGTIRLFLDSPSRRLVQVTIAPNASATVQYLHPDALGSSPLSTDELGNPVAMVDQDVYGLNRVSAGSQPTRSYTGKELDPSGWLYFGARYFSPQMGRFTQVDPVTLNLVRPGLENLTGGKKLEQILSDPHNTLHPYAYAANNPMKYVDPDGNNPLLAVAILAVGAYFTYKDIQHMNATLADPNASRFTKNFAIGMVAFDVGTLGAGAAEKGLLKVGLQKLAPGVMEHVMSPTIIKKASGEVLSGGHDLVNYAGSGLDTTGLAVDLKTKVPYLYYGIKDKFQTFFREGFSQAQIETAGNQLQSFVSEHAIPAGKYVRQMAGDAYFFTVNTSGQVRTFVHTIPRLVEKGTIFIGY
jgi:RHS repeat-associated protein